MIFFNNWNTTEEFILIEVSYKITEECLVITIAFIGLGLVITFKI